VKEKPQVPNVWPVFTNIRFMCIEVAYLEEVGFYLPRCAQAKAKGGNSNANVIPISKHGNKIVHHAPLGKYHNGKWLSRRTLIAIISQMKVVSNPTYGQVYSIESHGGVVAMTYKMTIGVEPNCSCIDFVFMLSNLKKRRQIYPLKTSIIHL
jgi:hypothetical protein